MALPSPSAPEVDYGDIVMGLTFRWNVSTLAYVRWDGSVTTGSGPSTASTSSVVSSATNVTLLASNTSAVGRQAYNDSDKDLYLKYGVTATTSSYTVKIPAGWLYVFPAPVYTGQVDGIWAGGPTGSARMTEV